MAQQTLTTKILLRNDTSTTWTSKNPLLLKGEIGFENDTLKFKVGNGVDNWQNLKYVSNGNSEGSVTKAVDNVTFDETTGLFTITYTDGTSNTIDTKLEKIVVNFTYDQANQNLVLTLDDGTTYNIPMSAFINVYSGSNGAMITISIDSANTISATIVDSSITESKLNADFVATLLRTTDTFILNGGNA